MHGLSTLNRLLGKKNKEVSRSTSNLNSALDTSSQHNRISPILNNAPFEQTFRVTVYLPKNQLYVERIGAKTKLERLLSDVCDSKNLNIDKFEFRHPTDMSQVFDNQRTIGEVGLNELRMVLKTESRFNSDFHRFHDDVIKYKSGVRDHSVTSSDEMRNLKNVSKTSPYSSTNSLNSLDSTGMNSTSNKTQQPVAPLRKKKRMAPRPPSQSSISEQQEIFTTASLNVFKEPHSILPRKNFHVSSPQLYNNSKKMSDSNNNIEMNSTTNRLNAITRPTSLYVGNSGNDADYEHNHRQRNNSESSEVQNILRDSTLGGSMQSSLERRKKKSPAPMPPSRKTKPVPSPRTIGEDDSRPHSIAEIREIDEQHEHQNSITAPIEEIPELDKNANHKTDSGTNVSKVLLNNDESEQNSSVDGPISIQIINESLSAVNEIESALKMHDETSSDEEEEEMTVNIYNITTKSVVTGCEKEAIMKETSSTTQQTVSVVHDNSHEVEVKEEIKTITTTVTTTVIEEERQRSPSPNWTYTLPAPPQVFADSGIEISPTDHRHDTTITMPQSFTTDYTSAIDNETIMSDSNTTTVSAETKIHPIILERRKTIEDSRYPAGIKDNESDKSAEIITSDLEDGYLGNNKIDGNSGAAVITIVGNSIASDSPEPGAQANRMEERELIVDDFQRSRLIITRSDSFHSIEQQRKKSSDDNNLMKRVTNVNALPQRSTSFLSLRAEIAANSSKNKINAVPYSKQKSTSELSISDVPSLQSLEVIKNILNSSRKNSLQDPQGEVSAASQVTVAEVKKLLEEPKVEEKKKEVIRQLESQMSEPSQLREVKKPSAAESQSQYRYSGPPKINFSTWSERPKVEVAVMNDGDYIFGGVNTATLPREFKNSVKIEPSSSVAKRAEIFSSKANNVTTPPVTNEKHMPPKVLGVEYKKDVSNTSVINIKPRPVSVDYSASSNVAATAKPINTANYQNSSTTQFVSYNRLSSKFTPIVHGFKLDNIHEQQQPSSQQQSTVKSLPIATNKITDVNEQKKAEAPIIPSKPAFLRSTSAGDINRKMKFSTAVSPPSSAAANDSQHFSNTLRRTGELEKILTNDKRTDSIFGKVIDSKQSQTMEESVQKVTVRQKDSQAIPPPPPPQQSIAFRKSAPAGELIDPRNQLLDAIKNFNKDSLRRK